MSDKELMQQALEALTAYDGTNGESKRKRVLAGLRERLAQPEMQPCAGRNCGSTNPNLHSAECFEDYEKATGMARQEPVAHSIVAGALFDFMGWLTSRRERLVLSSTDDAAPAADAIREFAQMRSLSINDAQVQEWQEHLAAPQPRQWQGLTDEEISSLWDGHIVPVFGKNGINPIVFARAIETKLKEKNNA